MHFLAILLGVIIGMVLFLAIVFFILYLKVRKTLRDIGYSHISSFKDMAKEFKKIKETDSKRVKSISGMTNLLLPQIRRDFPEFNENELYNKAVKSLRIIFSALENKETSELKMIPLLKSSLEKIIEDYKNSGINETYDDIIFHKWSIKDYNKKEGVATVTIVTSLEYYYKKMRGSEMLIDNTRYKKQTRYSCKFIYIYDELKLNDSSKSISINCPNCGAPIRELGHKCCEYCGSVVKDINLKAWMISSYEKI